MDTGRNLLAAHRVDVAAVSGLLTAGYAVVPLALPATGRRYLLDEAKRLTWNQGAETYGTRITRQMYDEVGRFPSGSPFWRLARELEGHFGQLFGLLTPNPLPDPLRFNDIRLQRYKPDSYGIGPHRDGNSCYGLVALFVLQDGGHLFVCDDHEKTNAHELEAQAGDLILLSGNGFNRKNVQPCHFLKMDARTRMTFGLRHKTAKKV